MRTKPHARRVAAAHGAFELHDSRVERIESEATGLCVYFAALYLTDEAHGWYQSAELFLVGGVQEGVFPAEDGDIWRGSLTQAGVSANVIPLPLPDETPLTLELTFAQGESLTLSGQAAWLTLIGEPWGFEDLPTGYR